MYFIDLTTYSDDFIADFTDLTVAISIHPFHVMQVLFYLSEIFDMDIEKTDDKFLSVFSCKSR